MDGRCDIGYRRSAFDYPRAYNISDGCLTMSMAQTIHVWEQYPYGVLGVWDCTLQGWDVGHSGTNHHSRMRTWCRQPLALSRR
jgi:hypothetical protein